MAKSVLVVDDEEDIRTSVKQVVESAGFTAKAVGSGKEALKALEKEKFDLVLLDMFMPEMIGLQVLEKIMQNKKTAGQKVAFLTVAQLNEAGKEKICSLNPIDYILKPVDVDVLTKKLGVWLK